jgi:hypothetical protein
MTLVLVQILFLLRGLTLTSADGTISLTQFSTFSIQRECVQGCLFEGPAGGNEPLPGYLNCNQPWSDSCYCRTDLAITASSFLNSCANKFCTGNTVDINNAESIYEAYCANNLNAVGYASSYSINSIVAYSSLRNCAQNCLFGGTQNGGPALPYALGCPNLNGCVCRADLAASASSFITSCVNTWCTGNSADINSAAAVYGQYCDGATATTSSAPSKTAMPGGTGKSEIFQVPLNQPQPCTHE